ncbi:hypothetical protein LB523_12320 [Mesorhizobium sp. ESP-6-4]|uniref:hypothetical protein n=1 Tax=Mesorhizobium sp. ESP-6-4 TaxID=2876624 RepID=UPI001CCC0B2E|nr:hypothetical protein [Mesorhizobium sp. ESP-6-4]MBZ9659832.1 hypothetical protein [Mesorhizobium sp. ESP-6-4]
MELVNRNENYTLEQLAADGAQQLQDANARAHNLYRPSIHRKRDGLLLVTCAGQGRFLTWFERCQLWLGITDAEKLERKVCRADIKHMNSAFDWPDGRAALERTDGERP